MGVGVSGGVVAAVHAVRRPVTNLLTGHAVVKLDFLMLSTASGGILDSIAIHQAAYSCKLDVLSFGEHSYCPLKEHS